MGGGGDVYHPFYWGGGRGGVWWLGVGAAKCGLLDVLNRMYPDFYESQIMTFESCRVSSQTSLAANILDPPCHVEAIAHEPPPLLPHPSPSTRCQPHHRLCISRQMPDEYLPFTARHDGVNLLNVTGGSEPPHPSPGSPRDLVPPCPRLRRGEPSARLPAATMPRLVSITTISPQRSVDALGCKGE